MIQHIESSMCVCGIKSSLKNIRFNMSLRTAVLMKPFFGDFGRASLRFDKKMKKGKAKISSYYTLIVRHW